MEESKENIENQTEETNSPNQEPSEEVEQLKEDIKALNDKYLRLTADFDNFRKRTHKEIIETISTANKKLILNILPIIDDFDRCFNNQKDLINNEGINLVYNKLTGILEKEGLEELKISKGDNFDSEKSEAISKIKVEEKLNNKVVDVIEKGYKLNDKIIRFAKVIIGE